MPRPELAHLELLAEIDALSGRLQRWADAAPAWQPAEVCQALVRRLVQRTQSLRVRLEAPLVVATLGGTGTGKSALVNALVGAEVVPVGRQRPTTIRPILVCRPELNPEMLGLDPAEVGLIQRDLPALAELVLVDCPDPDTTENSEAPGTNLARLRKLLPHCDVLLVTTTQQKYRSARVADELAAAATGARLVFVQTHADLDQDIRQDWREVLDERYRTGQIFLIDSPAALADAQAGLQPRGEFAQLRELLTRQLAGSAGNRIRRANFLDLLSDTLVVATQRIDQSMLAVVLLRDALEKQRAQLAVRLAQQTRAELLTSRRQWEVRLLGRITARWGFSPFSLVLRIFQGLGGLVLRAVLLRARTPAQLALWGALEGARTWQQSRSKRRADRAAAEAAAGCWESAQLRSAALILEGYASEAGLDRRAASPETVAEEAARAGTDFAAGVSAELDSLVDRLAARHAGWFTRWRYELLLAAMLGLLLYRLGRNFFYDSWLAPVGQALFGLEFYLAAGFWLVLWCVLLFWSFTSRLRRGLRREIDQLAQTWNSPKSVAAIFGRLEDDCRHVEEFRRELERLKQHVAELRVRLALPDEQLGHRR